MMMRKGLFGKSMAPGGMPGSYSMPQDQTMQDGANLAQQPAPQQRPGLGTRLFGQGWEGKAAALGGMLSGNPYAVQQYQSQQAELRAAPEREAAALAADQRKRAADLADYRSQMQIKQEFAGPPEMDEFDTAMARAGIPQGSQEYNTFAREYAERKARGADPFLQGAPIPGGGSFTGPYAAYQSMLGDGQPARGTQAPTRPVGGLTPIGGGSGGNVTGGFQGY